MSRRAIFRRLALSLWMMGAAAPGLLLAQAPEAAPAAPSSTFESIAQEVNAVFEKCRKAVVRIEASDVHGRLSGTGFFIDPNGTLYTSYTVGGETHDIVVQHGSASYPARRIVADPRSGIAILKVDAETPFLMPGKSRNLVLATPVVTIGYPMDLPLTPSFGTVAGFDVKYLGRFFATTHIRANMPVQRGEGGAPLLNLHGEVIGILIASLDSGSASFALPIAAAEKIRKDFIHFGEIRPGWMGVHVVTGDKSEGADPRALVEEVIAGGPAQKAGMQKGDVLLQIGSQKIRVLEDVVDASFFMTVEDALLIKVARQNQELELTLTPADHPSMERSRHLSGEPPLKIDR